MVAAEALSFPLAHLFEVGAATIWASALLHFVVRGTVKVVVVSGDGSAAIPLIWMATSATVPRLAFSSPGLEFDHNDLHYRPVLTNWMQSP